MNKEYTKYTVAVGLRCGDKFWMSQRINTPNFAGKWQFPGGKLEENENPLDGGLRELKEETNLDIDCKRVQYCRHIEGDPTTLVCYVYYIDLNDAEIPVRTENTMTDWRLFTYDEALKLDLMPGLVETLDKLKIIGTTTVEPKPNIDNETGFFSVDKETPAPTWKPASVEDYNRFVNEILKANLTREDSAVNGLTFDKLSKKYGSAYLDCVYAAYSCLGGSMSDEEFCKYWGNIPKGFFEKKIKHTTTFKKLN